MCAKKNTVLFVDDEIHILNSIRRATIDLDFKALFALSGREALQYFQEHEISVIVTDMRMPEMDGLTLLKAVRKQWPRTVRMVLSGYVQLSQILATINQGDIFQFIPKPWKMEEELLAAVYQALDYYNLDAERDVLRNELAQRNVAYQNILREMDQILTNQKNDVANLKRINHWTFRFWRKNIDLGGEYLEENKVAIKDYTELIEEFQLMYFDILPTKIETKTISAAVDAVVKACNQRLSIQIPENDHRTITGHHGFMLMTAKAVVYLVTENIKTVLQGDISLEADRDKAAAMTLNISLQNLNLPAVLQNKIKIGCALLSEIGKIYNIRILPETANSHIISVLVHWQAELPPAADSDSAGKEPRI